MKITGKRIIALVGCAAMFAGAAGCSKQQAANGDNVTTVSVWSGNSHSKEFYEEIVNQYNSNEGKKNGIYIDYQVKDGDSIKQTVELALQNGDAPDMFSSGDIIKLSENNYIASINELPGGEEFLKKYKDKLIERANTYNGKTYVVPVSATTQGLIYNKDMFKAAGIVDEKGEAKPPVTLAELREDAKKLTDTASRKYGIILPIKWNGWFSSDISGPMQSSAGHLGYNPVTGKYDYSAMVPIMKTMLGIKEDNSFFPGADGIDNDSARAQFAAGNVGMKFAFSFDVGVLNDQFPASCDWGVAPYPVEDANNKYLQRMDYGYSFYINKKSVDTVGGEKLLEVLKFFSSDELVQKAYAAGVNLPYDWDIVKDTKVTNDKTGWTEFAQLTDQSIRYPVAPCTDMGSEASIGTRFINDVWNGSQTPEELAEAYAKVMEDATKRYYDVHTEEDAKKYLKPNWNVKQ